MSGHKALDTANDIDQLLYYMQRGPDDTTANFLRQQIERRIANWRDEVNSMRKAGHTVGGSAYDDMKALADFYEADVRGASVGDIIEKPRGRMYEVDINAPPEAFLDWETPLIEQAPRVQNFFREQVQLGPHTSAHAGRPGFVEGGKFAGYFPHHQDAIDPIISRGDFLVREMGGHLPRGMLEGMMREYGIPGIRYLDAGSRAAGEGSRNYVVFDDALVNILRKYAMLPPAVGLGANALSEAAEQ
jgi:hypothetical protein